MDNRLRSDTAITLIPELVDFEKGIDDMNMSKKAFMIMHLDEVQA